MEHIRNFNNFLLESFLNDALNEEEKKKVGRIVIKDEEALKKMSIDQLKELGAKVKDAIDKANSGWDNVSPAGEKAKQQSIANGQAYLKAIVAIAKENGGDNKEEEAKDDTDKIKQEIEELRAQLKPLDQEMMELQKVFKEASDKKTALEREKKKGDNWSDDKEKELEEVKKDYDEKWNAFKKSKKKPEALTIKISDLRDKLKKE